MGRGSWMGLALGTCLVLGVLLAVWSESASPALVEPAPNEPSAPAEDAPAPPVEPAPTLPSGNEASLREPVVEALAATPPAALEEPSTAKLFGWLHASDGLPLAKVLVLLLGAGGSRNTRSSEDGNFRFGDLAPGAYRLWAHSSVHLPGDTLELRLAAGEDRGPLSLTLNPGLRAEGKIVDAASGEGVARARIRAQLDQQGPCREARSGSDGTFSLCGLETGDWWLSVQADGYLPAARWWTLPGGTAPPIELQGGAWLEGQVRGPAGALLAGAQLELTTPDGGSPMACRSDGEGAYRSAVVLPGSYLLTVSHAATSFNSREPVELPTLGAHRHDVHVLPGGTLQGYVHDSRGTAAEGAAVHLLAPGSQLRTRTEADGSFAFFELLPAEYTLQAVTADASSERLSAWPGDAQETLRLTLQPGFALRGQVLAVEGGPCEALVCAWPEDGPDLLLRHVLTGPDGRFELIGLPAGTYTLGAEGLGQSVSRTGYTLVGDSQIDLQLVAERSVPGRVAGHPVSTLGTVEVLELPARGFARLAMLDAAGGFLIEGLHPGRYEARLLDEPDAVPWSFSLPGSDSIILQLGD